MPTKAPDPYKSKVLVIGNPGGKMSPKAWRKFEQVGLRPELDLDELVFNWTEKRVRDLEAKGAVTAVQVESTIEAAPTLTVTVRDPERRLFRRQPARMKRRKPTRAQLPLQVDEGWDPILPPDVLGQPMQISLDGVTYQLVKVQHNTASDESQLTFEHELVYLLKRHKGAKRAPRARVTRAQFILSLVREVEPEVRKRRYRFVCPELNIKQPIEAGQKRQTQAPVSGTSSGGGGGRSLNRIFPAQHGSGGEVLSSAEVKACAAAGGFWGRELEAMDLLAERECGRRPGALNLGGDGGIGLWQMTPYLLLQGGRANWGPAALNYMEKQLGGSVGMRNPINNAKMARYLYEAAGKTYTPWVASTIAPGPGNGRPSRAEARELGETVAGGGSAEGTASTSGATQTKSYQFSRGAGENTWAAGLRLAQEVNWRLFMVGNSLYYMSEEQLYGRRPRYYVCPPGYKPPKGERGTDGVLGLTYDVDWGRPVSEASLTVTLARWGAPPGSVVMLDGFGPPDGRWLVVSVSRDYFAPTAEIKLVQPGKEKLEPAAETTQRTTRPGDGGPPKDSQGPAMRFYDRAVEISKKGYPYAWGGGHTSSGAPTASHRGEGTGYDCSGYIGACLIAAGIKYSGETSGSFGALPGAKPGKGKFISVHYSSGHVYASFEEALGVPHTRADTSSYGGDTHGSGARVRTTDREYPGYSVCHYDWPGD